MKQLLCVLIFLAMLLTGISNSFVSAGAKADDPRSELADHAVQWVIEDFYGNGGNWGFRDFTTAIAAVEAHGEYRDVVLSMLTKFREKYDDYAVSKPKVLAALLLTLNIAEAEDSFYFHNGVNLVDLLDDYIASAVSSGDVSELISYFTPYRIVMVYSQLNRPIPSFLIDAIKTQFEMALRLLFQIAMQLHCLLFCNCISKTRTRNNKRYGRIT